MSNLVPYNNYSFELETLPARPGTSENMEGKHQGVHILCHRENMNFLIQKFDVWFDGRDEVCLIENGTTEKNEQGFIILEWEECEIDMLFLAILNNEEVVTDYTVYTREDD